MIILKEGNLIALNLGKKTVTLKTIYQRHFSKKEEMNFIEFINQFKQKLSGWDPSLNDANIPRNAIGWKLKMIEKKNSLFSYAGPSMEHRFEEPTVNELLELFAIIRTFRKKLISKVDVSNSQQQLTLALLIA